MSVTRQTCLTGGTRPLVGGGARVGVGVCMGRQWGGGGETVGRDPVGVERKWGRSGDNEGWSGMASLWG